MSKADNRLKGRTGQGLMYLQGDIEIPLIDANGNALSYVGGKVYYVEANDGSDTADGLSWDTAFKTLTVALAASHANIATGSATWASRNRIYYKGDNAEAAAEDIVKLADKTDVIGVGSFDHNPRPMLIGNHLVVGTYMGTRFFNMGFRAPAAGGVVVTIPTTCSGIEFYGCVFSGRNTTPGTKGLLATAVEQLKVIGCSFVGKFSTNALEIGAGASNGLRIEDNDIESGAIGIVVSSTATCAAEIGKILNNKIYATTLVIDENSNKMVVGGNRCVTLAANTLALILDYNSALAYDNSITDSTVTATYPVLGTCAS